MPMETRNISNLKESYLSSYFLIALTSFFTLPILTKSYPSLLFIPIITISIALIIKKLLDNNFFIRVGSDKILTFPIIAILLLNSTPRSLADVGDLIYTATCLLAYIIGLNFTPPSKQKLRVIFLIFLPIILFGSINSSEYNTLATSGVRSNYIGIAIVTFALIGSICVTRRTWIYVSLTLLLTLLTFTRSLALGFLLAAILYHIKSKILSVSLFMIILVSIIFAVANGEIFNLLDFVSEDSIALTGKVLNSGRGEIWAPIIENMTIKSVTLGFSSDELNSINVDPRGLHNGILFIYARHGLIGVIAVFLIFSSILVHSKNTERSHTTILITTLMIKECFEVTLFTGNLAFAMPFWYFAGYIYRESIKIEKQQPKIRIKHYSSYSSSKVSAKIATSERSDIRYTSKTI